MSLLKQIDPFFLIGAVFSLVMVASSDPWWTLTGAGQNLLMIHISPFYLQTSATGLAPTVPFAQILGPLTRILLGLAFLLLGMISLSPPAWWRNLAVCFSLSVLAEVYLSFALLYHSAQTSLLGAYGVIPPYNGGAQLSTTVVGLDLTPHFQPFVIAGFSLSFYLGFVTFGLIVASLIADLAKSRRERKEQKGVAAIFTSDKEGRQGDT